MGLRSVSGSIRSGRAQKPHTSPTTPAPAPKKIYTGRVKHKYGAWCLEREEKRREEKRREEKGMNVPVGGCLKQNVASRGEKKIEKNEGWARIKIV